jgi:hypothetical protein
MVLLLIAVLLGCDSNDPTPNRVSLESAGYQAAALSPRWSVQLSPQLLAALESGVSLRLVEQLQWLDAKGRVLGQEQRYLQLSHGVLTGNYIITHPEREELRVFPGPSALLRGLRSTGAWPVTAPPQSTRMRLRYLLDRTSLPGSLRLQAVWNQSWRVDSGWVEQPLADGVGE